MMQDRDKLYLTHILESANLVERFLSGITKQKFLKSDMRQSAVIRQLEIIGEAAARVSRRRKEKMKEIPWREAISMRNFVIHDYFRVDNEKVWNTAKKDVPKLKRRLEKVIKDIDKSK